MEHLYLPPSLRYFTPLRVLDGSPGDHASFDYDLVEALRPKLVVDIGAGNALSFAVFCQSMQDHDVDGLAYAIDVWESDGDREARGDATLASINNFLHAHYRFAYLLRHDSKSALAHFSDASIDLLRFDLARLSEPPRELFDAWLPKIAPGGALVCAGIAGGTTARTEWRLRQQSGFVFEARGLGVTVFDSSDGREPNHELLRALRTTNESERHALASFYEHARRHHALKTEVGEHGTELARKRA